MGLDKYYNKMEKIKIENPMELQNYSNTQPQKEQTLISVVGTDETYPYLLYSRAKFRGNVWIDKEVHYNPYGISTVSIAAEKSVRIGMKLEGWSSSVFHFIPYNTIGSVSYVYSQIVQMYQKYRVMEAV
jgi:hypothetical protein